MPTVNYIEYSGEERQVDVPVGVSVMEGALQNMVSGIDGDCGGCCACATCHVYVDPQRPLRQGPAIPPAAFL